MAVFSNDPNIQYLWLYSQERPSALKRVNHYIKFVPGCPPGDSRCNTSYVRGLPKGWAWIGSMTPIDGGEIHPYYTDTVARFDKVDADLKNALAAESKKKTDSDNKAADAAAEQRILDRRKQQRDAISASCSRTQDGSWSGEFRAQMDAKCAEGKKNMPSNLPVTFAEIAAERGQSNLVGARAAPGVARALAQPRRTPRPRLPRPKPAPRVPKKPVLRAKRVSSASSG